MIVSLIAAMDRQRGIGIDNRLPWRLPADMKRFRDLTMGHHIIVGRKTFESIGKPLPGRQTIIVTRDRNYEAEGCHIVHSLDKAVALAGARGETEVFICGGAEIYDLSLEIADRIYLTLLDADVMADAFFPRLNDDEWVEKESLHHPADEKNQYSFDFKLLVRNRSARRE